MVNTCGIAVEQRCQLLGGHVGVPGVASAPSRRPPFAATIDSPRGDCLAVAGWALLFSRSMAGAPPRSGPVAPWQGTVRIQRAWTAPWPVLHVHAKRRRRPRAVTPSGTVATLSRVTCLVGPAHLVHHPGICVPTRRSLRRRRRRRIRAPGRGSSVHPHLRSFGYHARSLSMNRVPVTTVHAKALAGDRRCCPMITERSTRA